MRGAGRNKEWWERRRTPTQDPSTDLPGGCAGDPARGPRHSAACATHMRARNTQSREELSRGGLFRVPVAMRACHGSSPAQATKTKQKGNSFCWCIWFFFLCTTACGLGQRSASISSHVHRRPKTNHNHEEGNPRGSRWMCNRTVALLQLKSHVVPRKLGSESHLVVFGMDPKAHFRVFKRRGGRACAAL